MRSIHANSAREAIVKMCTLPSSGARQLNTRLFWNAYAALIDPDNPHVRRTDRHTVTDLISLVRYTLEQDEDLGSGGGQSSTQFLKI